MCISPEPRGFLGAENWELRTGNVPGAGAGVAPAAAMGPGGAVN